METIQFRHNVINVNSIKYFYHLRGSYNQQIRDVFFVRAIGEIPDLNEWILQADKEMDLEMAKGKLVYKRISFLPVLKNVIDSEFYLELFLKFEKGERGEFRNISFSKEFENAVADALGIIIKEYQQVKINATPSMIRNFGTKLLFWLDQELRDCFQTWSEKACIKVVSDNVVKEQEYLFYLFLTYLGCDVLLIENRGDVTVDEKLLRYSHKIFLGNFGSTVITPYCPYIPENQKKHITQIEKTKSKKKVVIPEKVGRKSKNKNQVSHGNAFVLAENETVLENVRKEKSYEELAQMAASVVLIISHDKGGNVIATGSGIMIGKNGYILTNYHVIEGGASYSVKIEDDQETYRTDEVIKYNATIDLAVIRIERKLNPISIYQGEKELVRGQKVVAIGSPLGLFNSVSDGIISGFRKIHEVDMIQFTAPISQGSSGGAVLNMQGEVIGISTGGFDYGQNINLAIGYENIWVFTNGFIYEKNL